MKKILILSGKGGTGKTTVAAAFAAFSAARAVADCDVDAPNLHLVLQTGEPVQQTPFFGGERAVIDPARCTGCGICAMHCAFGAIDAADGGAHVDAYACEGCGVCAYVCKNGAVTLQPDEAGTVLLYRDASRVFSTAQLRMGRGNSGKLVSQVKMQLQREAADAAFAVIDGAPGIGCPVIASSGGVDLVLIVAETSNSGYSDMQRLVQTVRMFDASLVVCVNKWDVNAHWTAQIQAFCAREQIPFAGCIPYDEAVIAAVNDARNPALGDSPAALALRQVYQKTMQLFKQ
jgi:MinD superfamily P-loop ATPase